MKYALLIDSENAEPRMDEIFQELTKYGDTPIRYLLGNFTQSSPTHPWIKICQKHAITCVQTMNFTKGKNSLDISLVIEGMKVLYEKAFIDGVIIIASDSDYTPLAREWRNAGKDVIGIGRKLTPESYRASCTKFIYVENIFNKKEEKPVVEEEDSDLVSLEKLEEVIESVLNENNGMAQLSVIVESIRKAYTDFDVRNYGFQKARDFFAASFKDIKLTEEKKNSFFISFKDKDEMSASQKVLKEKTEKTVKAKKEKETRKKKKEIVTEILQSTWSPEEEKPVEESKPEVIVPVEEPTLDVIPEAIEAPKPKITREEVFEKVNEFYASQKKMTFSKMSLLCKKNHINFRELGYTRFKDFLKDYGFVVEGSIVKRVEKKSKAPEANVEPIEENPEVAPTLEEPAIVEEPTPAASPETTEAPKPQITREEVMEKVNEFYASQKKMTFSKMNLLCKKSHINFRELGYTRFKDFLKDYGFIVEGSIVKRIEDIENSPEVALEPSIEAKPADTIVVEMDDAITLEEE